MFNLFFFFRRLLVAQRDEILIVDGARGIDGDLARIRRVAVEPPRKAFQKGGRVEIGADPQIDHDVFKHRVALFIPLDAVVKLEFSIEAGIFVHPVRFKIPGIGTGLVRKPALHVHAEAGQLGRVLFRYQRALLHGDLAGVRGAFVIRVERDHTISVFRLPAGIEQSVGIGPLPEIIFRSVRTLRVGKPAVHFKTGPIGTPAHSLPSRRYADGARSRRPVVILVVSDRVRLFLPGTLIARGQQSAPEYRNGKAQKNGQRSAKFQHDPAFLLICGGSAPGALPPPVSMSEVLFLYACSASGMYQLMLEYSPETPWLCHKICTPAVGSME